jgi:hypothetical protein
MINLADFIFLLLFNLPPPLGEGEEGEFNGCRVMGDSWGNEP